MTGSDKPTRSPATMGAKTIASLQMTSPTTNSTPVRESVDVRSSANCAPSAPATNASTATTLQARAPMKVRLSANCASAVNCVPPAAATSASTDTTTLQVRAPVKAANEPGGSCTVLPRNNTPSTTTPATAKATLKANKVAGEDIGVAKAAHTTQDRKNVQWDRELKKRETAVSHAERQMAAQRSTISNLDERLNEVEQNNRLLKLKLATQPPPTNVPQSGMPPTVPQSAHMPPPVNWSNIHILIYLLTFTFRDSSF